MSKKIDIKLAEDYAGHAMTMGLITRIRTKSGQLFGYTDVDFPINYNAAPYVDSVGTSIPGDDFGMMEHVAENGGFSMSKFDAAADLSVDNSELKTAPDETVVTPQKLRAGLFDSAEVYVYRVNFMDLTRGHEMIAYGLGDTARVSGSVTYTAFRSMSDRLKETEVEIWSKTCPSKFGGPKCPKEYVWVAGEVTGVDPDDPARIFGTDVAAADDFYIYGILLWTSGDNAGKEYDVERNESNTFSLLLEMDYPAQIGDAFTVRQDCSKIYDDADHGCLYHWGPAERNRYHRGCPDIPTGDGGSSMIPGNNMEYDE